MFFKKNLFRMSLLISFCNSHAACFLRRIYARHHMHPMHPHMYTKHGPRPTLDLVMMSHVSAF